MDLLKIAGDCGLPVASYRYIGMGANKFYDFLLIHKYLGVRDMISIEHDDIMYRRAEFNVPYNFITVENCSVADYIDREMLDKPVVLWLDYDGGLSQSLVRDIGSLATKLKVGDFCFVTAYGGPPRSLDMESDEGRLVWLQDRLGDVSGEVTIEDVESASFSKAVHKILLASFRNAFAPRREGSFRPFLQVEYSDSTPMVTVGGGFLAGGQASEFLSRLAEGMPFLYENRDRLYSIQSWHLTERERSLFDRAATKPNLKSSERNTLRRLGFSDEDIKCYRDLIRYLPRYVETIV
jgi:hypothetical protein